MIESESNLLGGLLVSLGEQLRPRIRQKKEVKERVFHEGPAVLATRSEMDVRSTTWL